MHRDISRCAGFLHLMQQWNSAKVQGEKHKTMLIVIIPGLARSKNYIDDYLCNLKRN